MCNLLKFICISCAILVISGLVVVFFYSILNAPDGVLMLASVIILVLATLGIITLCDDGINDE